METGPPGLLFSSWPFASSSRNFWVLPALLHQPGSSFPVLRVKFPEPCYPLVPNLEAMFLLEGMEPPLRPGVMSRVEEELRRGREPLGHQEGKIDM